MQQEPVVPPLVVVHAPDSGAGPQPVAAQQPASPRSCGSRSPSPRVRDGECTSPHRHRSHHTHSRRGSVIPGETCGEEANKDVRAETGETRRRKDSTESNHSTRSSKGSRSRHGSPKKPDDSLAVEFESLIMLGRSLPEPKRLRHLELLTKVASRLHFDLSPLAMRLVPVHELIPVPLSGARKGTTCPALKPDQMPRRMSTEGLTPRHRSHGADSAHRAGVAVGGLSLATARSAFERTASTEPPETSHDKPPLTTIPAASVSTAKEAFLKAASGSVSPKTSSLVPEVNASASAARQAFEAAAASSTTKRRSSISGGAPPSSSDAVSSARRALEAASAATTSPRASNVEALALSPRDAVLSAKQAFEAHAEGPAPPELVKGSGTGIGALDFSSNALRKAHNILMNTMGPGLNWMLIGYGGTKNIMSLYDMGGRGVNEMVKALRPDEVQIAYVRVTSEVIQANLYVLVYFMPQSVDGIRKARAASHKPQIEQFFDDVDLVMCAETKEELDQTVVFDKLEKAYIKSIGESTAKEEEPAYDDAEGITHKDQVGLEVDCKIPLEAKRSKEESVKQWEEIPRAPDEREIGSFLSHQRNITLGKALLVGSSPCSARPGLHRDQ
eukprot:m51a1_g2609 hypothetical protein (616) ;mRNA; f:489000-491641